MEYKQYTPEQVVELFETLDQYPMWYRCVKFIKQYWQDTAYRFELESDEGEYDDEGGTDYHLRIIKVYDKDNKVVPFDFNKPAFRAIYKDDLEDSDNNTPLSELLKDHDFFDILEKIREFYIPYYRKEDKVKKFNLPIDFVVWNEFPRTHDYDTLNCEFNMDSFNDVALYYKLEG